jgi:hypothetical protein
MNLKWQTEEEEDIKKIREILYEITYISNIITITVSTTLLAVNFFKYRRQKHDKLLIIGLILFELSIFGFSLKNILRRNDIA